MESVSPRIGSLPGEESLPAFVADLRKATPPEGLALDTEDADWLDEAFGPLTPEQQASFDGSAESFPESVRNLWLIERAKMRAWKDWIRAQGVAAFDSIPRRDVLLPLKVVQKPPRGKKAARRRKNRLAHKARMRNK
jgi:hypothetical protein